MLEANQTVEGAQVNSHFSQCHGIAALNVCQTANRMEERKKRGKPCWLVAYWMWMKGLEVTG